MKMIKVKLKILLFCIVLGFISCATSYNARTFEFARTDNEFCEKNNYHRIALSIENDSILRLIIVKYPSVGGYSQSVKYRMNGNKIIIDSLANEYVNEFFGTSFAYHKDSIVDEKTNDLFYSRKYIDKLNKKLKRDFLYNKGK
jgi:hypothetical protein